MKKHFLALLLSLSLLPMLFPTFVNAQGTPVQVYIGTPGTTSITTEIGRTVTLTAVDGSMSPPSGIQWYKSNSSDLNNEGTMITNLGVTSPTYTVPTNATGTYYYYCTYSQGDYKSNVLTVTVNDPSYTVSAASSPGWGGTVTGAGSYTAGSSCTLTATPATAFNFVNWTENGAPVNTNHSYSFTVSSNRNLTANFVKVFSVNDNFSINNIKYSITSLSSAQVAVIGSDVKSLTIPSTVNYKGVNFTVKSIGEYAFYKNSGLTSVTIPESVTSIGMNAFCSCQNLASVTISNGVTEINMGAFLNDISLTSVTIPDSVTTIGVDAFGFCTSLTSVTIPASVTTIEDYAFDFCSKLGVVTIANSSTSIASNAFQGTTNLVFCSDKEKRPSSWSFWSGSYHYYKIGTFSGTVSTVENIGAATVVSLNGGLGGAKTSLDAVPPATVDSMRTAAGIPASYATIAAGDLKIGNGEFNGSLTITLLLNSSLDQYDMAKARVLHNHGGALEVLTPELSPARIVDGAMSNSF